jgi:hypothetical protein
MIYKGISAGDGLAATFDSVVFAQEGIADETSRTTTSQEDCMTTFT